MSALPSPADLELFEAIHAGRAGWQSNAVRLHGACVRAVVVRNLGRGANIEDVVSDVFLRFFERAHHIRHAHAVRTYLVAIAQNTVRNEIRRRQRHREFFDDCDATLAIANLSARDNPMAHAALHQLAAILERLHEEDRQAYILREIVGLDVLKVARRLGISKSTTQRRIRAAGEFVRKSAARSALLSHYMREI